MAMYLAIVGNIHIITAWDFRFAINHAADLYGSSQNSTATYSVAVEFGCTQIWVFLYCN